MKKLSFLFYLLLVSTISFGQFQTEELIFNGTGDLIMNLGRYQIGTSITITTQISGGWAEDGGIYHIVGDWQGLPKVIYRGESSISKRLLFFGYLDNSAYAYLFAKWINESPNKSQNNTVRLTIHSSGYFSKTAQGDFSSATQLRNILTIKSNTESIGIGTTTTGSHKLAVDGSIGAREIQVESSEWSDFVFEDNYELKSINELESYIEKNKRLPDIPSASEVEKDGIKLGEMDAKLLQKVEELTLYMIEQNKRIEKLEKENELLKEQKSL